LCYRAPHLVPGDAPVLQADRGCGGGYPGTPASWGAAMRNRGSRMPQYASGIEFDVFTGE